jgi:hypothetical protein
MLIDLITLGAGFIILALTSLLFWFSVPTASGPRWFIGTLYETVIALVVVCGLTLGLSALVTGILPLVGVR